MFTLLMLSGHFFRRQQWSDQAEENREDKKERNSQRRWRRVMSIKHQNKGSLDWHPGQTRSGFPKVWLPIDCNLVLNSLSIISPGLVLHRLKRKRAFVP
jgi:hypothetical protein